MSMAAFLIATGIGQLPATIVYSYVGGMLTGSVKMVVTALLLIFALSVFVALAKKIYTDKHSKYNIDLILVMESSVSVKSVLTIFNFSGKSEGIPC